LFSCGSVKINVRSFIERYLGKATYSEILNLAKGIFNK